jgi:hypothetical protein
VISLDVGRGRRTAVILRIGGLAGAAASLAVVAIVMIAALSATRSREALDRAYWLVAGPPCQQAPLSALLAHGQPLAQVFAFEGLRAARISGAVNCSGVTTGRFPFRAHADVCEFTGPLALSVAYAGRDYRYALKVGQPVTITARPDGLGCVLASNFR